MNQQERNKNTFKRLLEECINAGNLGLAEQLLTVDRPDHQEMGGMPPEMLAGYAGFQRVIGMFREGFPDLRFTSQYMIAEGDRVLSYNVIEGTHRGAFMGIPPTGKSIRTTAADVCRFNDEGKISEHWGVFDTFAMMMQLGVIPAPGAR